MNASRSDPWHVDDRGRGYVPGGPFRDIKDPGRKAAAERHCREHKAEPIEAVLGAVSSDGQTGEPSD